jgi:hypothetical protein
MSCANFKYSQIGLIRSERTNKFRDEMPVKSMRY